MCAISKSSNSFLLCLTAIVLLGCVPDPVDDGDELFQGVTKGRVVDATTGERVEGAVVVIGYQTSRHPPSFRSGMDHYGGPSTHWCTAVMTDTKGYYSVPPIPKGNNGENPIDPRRSLELYAHKVGYITTNPGKLVYGGTFQGYWPRMEFVFHHDLDGLRIPDFSIEPSTLSEQQRFNYLRRASRINCGENYNYGILHEMVYEEAKSLDVPFKHKQEPGWKSDRERQWEKYGRSENYPVSVTNSILLNGMLVRKNMAGGKKYDGPRDPWLLQ